MTWKCMLLINSYINTVLTYVYTYIYLEYLSDTYLLFLLPHTHTHTHLTRTHAVVFWCITSVVLSLLSSSSWITPGLHHTSVSVCVLWVRLLIGALSLLITPQPRLLTYLLCCDRSSEGRWWWWEGMLSLTSAHLYPFQVQPEPTDSTSPLISVQLPLCLQHTDMHAYIYKYLYSAQMSCQHGPIGCAAPPTVYSRSFNWSVVQHLTFSLFSFIFMTHHVGPTVTLDSVFISQPKPTPRAGVNLWHYSVPIELKGDCQGTKTAGSWVSSGSHFGPIGSGQRTFVGGDWEVNKTASESAVFSCGYDFIPAEVRDSVSAWLWQVAMWLRPSQ